MCGFVGLFGCSSSLPEGLVAHRGPDQTFRRLSGCAEIEFNRLAVTGGLEGELPVRSDDGRWEVYLNGEIYNFRALIERWGVKHSYSDTKALARGVSKLGLKAFLDLRGMFAGLIVDNLTGNNYVFRDALGEKPAFWRQGWPGILVASEASALVDLDSGSFSIDKRALLDFLHFGYVEEPTTIFSGIFSVPRGAVSKIDVEHGRLITILTLTGFSSDETDAPLKDIMKVVLCEQLAMEVPSTLALSGGVDSNFLAWSLRGQASSVVRTHAISINLPDRPKLSESRQAQRAARHYGLPFTTIDLKVSAALGLAEEVADRADQPIGDVSSIGYMEIFRKSRELGAKVVVLGHGPDELFWGYPWVNAQLVRSVQDGTHYENSTNYFWRVGQRIGFEEESPLFFRRDHSFASSDRFLEARNPFLRARAFTTHSYLAHNGFAQSDRLAMSFGLEPRTPLADSRLYGWAGCNPSANGPESFGKTQFLGAVPLRVRYTAGIRKKRGFSSPLPAALRMVPPSRLHPQLRTPGLEDEIPEVKIFQHVLGEDSVRQSLVLLSLWLEAKARRGLHWTGSWV